MRAVLQCHLRGLFTVPKTIAPTDADIAWFAEHGRVYTRPRPHETIRGVPGECWSNAARALWKDRSLFYVQGLVRGRHDLLTPHAWCTRSTGELIEMTWDVTRATGGELYIGVPLSLDELVRLQMHFGRYGWYDSFADVLLRQTA